VPGHHGGHWSDHDCRNWRRRVFQPAADAAGPGTIGPCDLRHSFVSLLIADSAICGVFVKPSDGRWLPATAPFQQRVPACARLTTKRNTLPGPSRRRGSASSSAPSSPRLLERRRCRCRRFEESEPSGSSPQAAAGQRGLRCAGLLWRGGCVDECE
jgi:hypothetical protein